MTTRADVDVRLRGDLTLYARLSRPGADRVGDSPSRYGAPVPEKLLHCLWYDGRFDPAQLRTRDGRPVRVLSPGLWNLTGAGPDFRHAEIRIGETPFRGDVEIHRRLGDWTAHGHHVDPAYVGVILHVALEGDLTDRGTRTSSGDEVPECLLGGALSQPLGVLSREITAADFPGASFAGTGRCYALLAARPAAEERLPGLLDSAGHARLGMKAERWRRLAGRVGREAAFVRGVARALGYRKNAAPFERLAEAVPPIVVFRWREAAPPEDFAEGLAAALMHAAGLLGEPASIDPATSEMHRRYRDLLGRLHAVARPRFTLMRGDWRFDGQRPTNSPERRIAGLAALLASWPATGRTGDLLAALGVLARSRAAPAGPSGEAAGTEGQAGRLRGAWLTLASEFLTPLDGYWAWRSTFGGRPFARPARAIGPERAHSIVTNVVLPMALAAARASGDRALAETARALWKSAPSSRPDFPTRFVAARMFGPGGDGRAAALAAAARQGALLLFENWCAAGASGCDACPLAAALEGGQATPDPRPGLAPPDGSTWQLHPERREPRPVSGV